MAHDLFPAWLLQAGVARDDELCKKRAAGVDALAERVSVQLVPTLIRSYLGRTLTDAELKPIRIAFRKSDPFFPFRGNEYELRILAGAVLVQLMEVERGVTADIASMLLDCNISLLNEELPIPEITVICRNYLRSQSGHKRIVNPVPTIDTANELNSLRRIASKLDQTTGALRKDTYAEAFEAMAATVENIRQSNLVLEANQHVIEEEATLAWWLLVGHTAEGDNSHEGASSFKAIASGVELSKFIKLAPWPKSSDAILKRYNFGLGIDMDSKVGLIEAVNSIPRSWRTDLKVADSRDSVTDLCPFLLAVSSSLRTDEGSDWQAVLKQSLGYIPAPMTLQELSYRSFRESLASRLFAQSVGAKN